MINSTIVDVAIKNKLTEEMVLGILDRNIKSEVNWETLNCLGVLGIDEIALKKGYKDYVTIVTSRIDGKINILAVLSGRKKATIKAFLKGIPRRLKKTVTAICVDMYEGYINAAKEIFKKTTIIVIDRFHVAKHYRGELDKYRQKTLRQLKKDLSERNYKKLIGATNILRKGNECLTKEEKEILTELFSYSPELMEAYRCAIQLTQIFNTHLTKGKALLKFEEWIHVVRKNKLTCFNKFIKTLRKFKNEISNYFLNRNTSAFVEGLNNKIKVLKRRCYGIFNVNRLFQRLYLDVSGYDVLLGKTSC